MSLFFWINLMIIGTGISQSQCKNWRNGFSSYISPRRLYVIIAHGYIVPALSRFISYIRTLYILRAEGKLGFRMIISRRNCLYTVINVRVWIFITENIDCGKRLFCGLNPSSKANGIAPTLFQSCNKFLQGTIVHAI